MNERSYERLLSVGARAIDHAGDIGRKLLARVATLDLNPDEGKLRGSLIPSRYINTPDFPPIHDDSIPG